MSTTGTNVVAHQGSRSVFVDMADKFGMERAAFEATLMATVMPNNATREQVAAFLLVCKQYDLNPFLKQIFAFPTRGGGIQPVVSVDGWAGLINRNDQFDGMEFVDRFAEEDPDKLVSITCRMHRKDRSHPVEVTEYMLECRRPTDTWKQWPARMLRHKAMIQAARYAFGYSGIMDVDEYERSSEAVAHYPRTDERLERHNAALEQYLPAVNAIKAAIEKEDWYSMSEEWTGIPQAAQMDLWVAPSKGGIFSTHERDCIKNKLVSESSDPPSAEPEI